jgi:hypothetical protein
VLRLAWGSRVKQVSRGRQDATEPHELDNVEQLGRRVEQSHVQPLRRAMSSSLASASTVIASGVTPRTSHSTMLRTARGAEVAIWRQTMAAIGIHRS